MAGRLIRRRWRVRHDRGVTTINATRLTVRPLTGTIGAVIDGVDLAAADAVVLDAVREAVLRHRVVFLPGQDLDDGGLRRVASSFGPLARSPLHELLGVERWTSVIADDVERPPAGFDWHTDLSWIATPPAFGFLHALDIPPYGGDTLWADQVAALASLPDDLQAMARDLWAEHRCDASLLATIERHHGRSVAVALSRAHPAMRHPLVRQHRDTGEAGLFLSPMYLRRICDIDPRRSERLLDRLGRTLLDPHHQVRWRWSTGDVAIWDETTTCHRALTDHHPQPRRMRRCVVAGEAPSPVQGHPALDRR